MYDVNYDEFEPVDPSDGGTYSTAMPERKRHVGLAIGMSLLAVALCAGITAASLFSVRIERKGGSTSVIFTERKSDIPVSEVAEAPHVDSVPEPEVVVRHPEREASSPTQELYTRLQSCVASVVPDYSALDNPMAAEGSACTGVVMSPDGYIITCYHAILTDLAVLKIEADGLTAASFGDSDQLAVGEQVLSLSRGEDERLGSVLTEGIVCALGRDLDFNGRAISVMQTDAGVAGENDVPHERIRRQDDFAGGIAFRRRTGQVVGFRFVGILFQPGFGGELERHGRLALERGRFADAEDRADGVEKTPGAGRKHAVQFLVQHVLLELINAGRAEVERSNDVFRLIGREHPRDHGRRRRPPEGTV